MSVYGQGLDVTLVAGADLSAKQYQVIGRQASGVVTLASSPDNVFGILQNKPQAGEFGTVRVDGLSKIYMSVSLGEGALLMGHLTTSGFIALASSGYCAFGELFITAASGGYGAAYLYGGALKRLIL
jgi:hypothetical protein